MIFLLNAEPELSEPKSHNGLPYSLFWVFQFGLGENSLKKLVSEAIKKFKLFDEGVLKFSVELTNF